jgi:hypothetical protein
VVDGIAFRGSIRSEDVSGFFDASTNPLAATAIRWPNVDERFRRRNLGGATEGFSSARYRLRLRPTGTRMW